MDLFNHFVSVFIGALIAVLPAGNTGVETQIVTDVSATATPTVETVRGLAALRAELIELQARFSASGSRSERSDDDSDDSIETETHASFAASTTVADDRGRGEAEFRGRAAGSIKSEDVRRSEDDEHESESDEDDDDSQRRGGRGTAIPVVPSIGAGVSGSVGTQTAAPTTFTAVQVAAHASASSCYSSVNGSVYDLTAWISQHPGGSAAIKSMCGKDGSAAFDGQHGGQGRPESELAGFKIGTLVQ